MFVYSVAQPQNYVKFTPHFKSEQKHNKNKKQTYRYITYWKLKPTQIKVVKFEKKTASLLKCSWDAEILARDNFFLFQTLHKPLKCRIRVERVQSAIYGQGSRKKSASCQLISKGEIKDECKLQACIYANGTGKKSTFGGNFHI